MTDRQITDFALGKQTETIAQEDIEKAAEAFATPPIGNGGMFTREQVKELLVRFAQLLLSKQEKDAEDIESEKPFLLSDLDLDGTVILGNKYDNPGLLNA